MGVTWTGVVQAQDFKRLFTHALDRLMLDAPILATPTAVIAAGSITDPSPPDGHLNSRNTSIFNLTGQPSVSVPCGFTGDGLPVGLMLTGARFDDRRVLTLAAAYERATDWHSRRPPGG